MKSLFQGVKAGIDGADAAPGPLTHRLASRMLGLHGDVNKAGEQVMIDAGRRSPNVTACIRCWIAASGVDAAGGLQPGVCLVVAVAVDEPAWDV